MAIIATGSITIADLSDGHVGGRNYIRNSKDMIYEGHHGIFETATGNPVVITDAVEAQAKLQATIEPKQAGTGDPTPSNVRSITGYDSVTVTRIGKNMLSMSGTPTTIQGVAWSVRNDGAIIGTRTSTSSNVSDFVYSSLTLSAGSYIYTCFDTESSPGGSTYQSNLKVNGTNHWGAGIYTFTLAEDTTVECILRVYSGFTGSAIFKPMIRFSTISDTSYAPYSSSTILISLSAVTGGTVYSGELTINRDGSGTLVVDKAMQTYNGSENWVLNANGNGRFYYEHIASGSAPASEYADNSMCNIATYRNSNTVYGAYYARGSAGIYFNKLNSSDTLEAFQTRLATNNAQIIYPLAEPLTYTFTADQLTTLLGTNTIWTNTSGDLEIEYDNGVYNSMETEVMDGSTDSVLLLSGFDSATYVLETLPHIDGEYIYTVWVKPTADTSLTMDVLGTQQIFNLDDNDGWQKLEIYNSSPTTDYVTITPTGDNDIYLYKSMLEQGDVASDWSPAPEDIEEVQEQIEDVQQDVNRLEERVTRTELKVEDDAIISTVTQSSRYTNDLNTISSSITQLSDSVSMQFDQTTTAINNTYGPTKAYTDDARTYIDFDGGGVHIGKNGDPFTMDLSNNELAFNDNGNKVAYINNQTLHITNAEVLSKFRIGKFEFVPTDTGMALIYVGDEN